MSQISALLPKANASRRELEANAPVLNLRANSKRNLPEGGSQRKHVSFMPMETYVPSKEHAKKRKFGPICVVEIFAGICQVATDSFDLILQAVSDRPPAANR